ncbi:MAG: motility protein A [Phycisphaerales bacterium]|nr:MAG: MotA/TolQ/ExbB proton channel family protein [Phycisphaerales bacterium]
MDIASLIGVLIGVSALGFVFYEVSHGHFEMFFSLEGVLMVGCGSVSVVFMAMPLDRILSLPGYMKRFMFHKGLSPAAVLQLVNTLSEKARRDGILALESEMANIKDPFLSAGLKMAIDGIEPGVIESTCRMQLVAMQERHKAGKKFFDLIKVYGPGYGLVGTLVGQVGLFGNLASADIGQLGKALAIAVVATMYGAVIANAVAGPIGDKLGMRSSEEMLGREMMLQAILSIQAGDNPRVTEDKIMAFIPTAQRLKMKAA